MKIAGHRFLCANNIHCIDCQSGSVSRKLAKSYRLGFAPTQTLQTKRIKGDHVGQRDFDQTFPRRAHCTVPCYPWPSPLLAAANLNGCVCNYWEAKLQIHVQLGITDRRHVAATAAPVALLSSANGQVMPPALIGARQVPTRRFL